MSDDKKTKEEIFKAGTETVKEMTPESPPPPPKPDTSSDDRYRQIDWGHDR